MKTLFSLNLFWIIMVLHPTITLAKDFILLDAPAREAVLQKVPADMRLIRDYLKDLDTPWKLHRGDFNLDGDWANGEALIVEGNVTVSGTYDDRRDGIGMLIVLGDMQANNVLSWGALAVTGRLSSPGLVYAYFNDYTFEVTALQARAFVSFDKSIYVRDQKSELILTDLAVQSEDVMAKALSIFLPEVIAPALDDFFGDKLWGVIPDYDACRKVLLAKSSIFRAEEAPKSIYLDVTKMISADVTEKEVESIAKKDPLLKMLAQMR